MNKRYNNYHKHSMYSNVYSADSNASIEDYCKRAIELGHKNIFTCEHAYGGDVYAYKSVADRYNLKTIYSAEVYIVKNNKTKDASNYHMVFIARTDKARKKLNLLISDASINGFYYRPRLDVKKVIDTFDKDDVYISTACIAGILRDRKGLSDIFVPLFEKFKENLFLEVQCHNDKTQIEINKRCLQLKNKFKLKIIASNDSHYIYKSDSAERDVVLLGKGISYDNEDNFILDYPDYDEWVERFVSQGVLGRQEAEEAINNTLLFDDCEEIKIDKVIKMPSIHKKLSIDERHNLLFKIIKDNFRKIIIQDKITKDELPRYLEGIKQEFEIIVNTSKVHTVDYFLLNEKLINKAINEYGGVLTKTSRGSMGSFYINRILGFTQLDRFRTSLPLYPDRFLSVARAIESNSLPDCDFNTANREPFVQASKDILGEHGCYWMIAFGTMKDSEAFRNLCRSKKLDVNEYTEIAKNIDAYTDNSKWKSLIEESKKYVGTIVSASVHPCSTLLMDKDIREEVGVLRIGENLCAIITSGEADDWKYLKNDLLKVEVWDMISKVFNKINKDISLYDFKNSYLDKKTYDIYSSGLTCTVNQADSDYATSYVKQYNPKTPEDLAKFTGAIRPNFETYRDKFMDRSPYSSGVPQMDELFNSTDHYVIFQENLMQWFVWLGETPATAITLIKKISKKKIKKEDFDKLEESLRKNWIMKVGDDKDFDRIWKEMQSMMNYGFNSPHALSMAYDSLYCAYLKSHYPLEYYAVAFNMYSNDTKRTPKLKEELKHYKINLLPIKFRYSKAEYEESKETNSIYKGIGSIKYCNETIASELYELGKYEYKNFVELLIKIENETSVDSRQLNILISLDFFKEFGSNKYLLKIVNEFNKLYKVKQINKSKIEKLEIPEYLIKKYSNKETKSLYKEINNESLIIEIIEDFDSAERLPIANQMKIEMDYLGYVEYKNDSLNENLYFVKEFNLGDYNCPKMVLRQIKTGLEVHIRIKYSKTFTSQPFKKYAILKVVQTKEVFRKRRTPEGKYVAINETEFILNKYEVIYEGSD